MQKLRGDGVAVLLAALLGIFLIGTAAAAETADGEVYCLAADQVIEDDLYVGASEIYIDSTIEGDLIAAGGYIEINGVVTGDAIVAGAGIELNGQVQDDVRAAGAGINISGAVGDDLVATAAAGSALSSTAATKPPAAVPANLRHAWPEFRSNLVQTRLWAIKKEPRMTRTLGHGFFFI
jgi:hypothetical protein